MQVIAGAVHGGAETFFERLVPALESGIGPQHVVMRRNPARARQLKASGLIPIELRFGGPLDLLSRWQLGREIRLFGPDIVMSWMSRVASMTPTGRHVHCGRLGGYYNLKYFRTCDHLIGNTRAIVDYLIGQGWPPERAHYLPNFVPELRSPALERQSLETPDDAPLLLALGRLHDNKAFDILLRALALVPEAHLWLAGSGPQEAALKALASELGVLERARFLGWREDTAALYAAADLVLVPSRLEPLGNVVLEAWSQAKPLIASRAAGPAALVEDGHTGILVEIDQPEAMAAAIRGLIDDPAAANAFAEAGRAAYDKEFSEAKVVARYLQFFHQVVP